MEDIKKYYNEILDYDYKDYVEMKEHMGWGNVDVAQIVGYKHMSVKNQTQPSKKLPMYAQMLIYVWRQEYQQHKYIAEGRQVEKFSALVEQYKKEMNELRDENFEQKVELDKVSLELRKEQRKVKKLTELLEKLESIEEDSEVTIPEKPTMGLLKRELSSLQSKHNRKVKVMEKIKELDLIPTTKNERPKVSVSTKKGVTKGQAKGVTPKKGDEKKSRKRVQRKTRNSTKN